MRKVEDKMAASMRVLKTATCPALSGKGKLTYQLGSQPDDSIYLRITGNTGGGHFSPEWIAWTAIEQALQAGDDGDLTALDLKHLYRGRSVNSRSFLLATLRHLKVVEPMAGKQRLHTILPPAPFLAQTQTLLGKTAMQTKVTKKKSTKKKASKKTTTHSAPTRTKKKKKVAKK